MRYEEYTGVSSLWVDKLPNHWSFKHLRTIFGERKESNDPVRITEILSLSAKSGVQRYGDKTHEGGNKATNAAILATMSSGIELYKAVQGNESFRKWIMDMVFNATYSAPVAARKGKPTIYSPTEIPVLKVAEPPVPYGMEEGV